MRNAAYDLTLPYASCLLEESVHGALSDGSFETDWTFVLLCDK